MHSKTLDEQSIGIALKNIIGTHLKTYPNVSLRGLASRNEGIGREYLRRLAEGSIADEKIDRYKVLLVLMLLSKKRELKDLCEFYGGPVASFLKDSFSLEWDEALTAADRELEFLVAEEKVEHLLALGGEESVVYHLAHTYSGVSEREARKILGEGGVLALRRLVEEDLLTEENGIYRGKHKSIFKTSFATAKKVAQTFLNLYRPSHVGRQRNWIMTFTGSLNKNGIIAEQEAFRRFSSEILNIYHDPQYRGDIHCFAVACMDSCSVIEEEKVNEVH